MNSHKESTEIISIYLPDLPIYAACFIQEGNQIVMTGNRKFFYFYDLTKQKIEPIPHLLGHEDEKDLRRLVPGNTNYFCILSSVTGYVLVLSQKSKRVEMALKMNGSAEVGCFSQDESYLYTAGDEGEIYVWDLVARKCIQRIADEGGFKITCLDASPDSKYLAAGSKSGTCNIYLLSQGLFAQDTPQSAVKPVKTVFNLTTTLTTLKFHPSSQILLIASKWKKNAVKLVHLPSFTVF